MVDIIPEFPAFLLVFVRVTSFFLMMPLFSYRTIPGPHKIGFSFFLAWIMFYTLDAPELVIDAQYFMLVIKEAMVGLTIGFIAYVVMSVIQVVGGFIDFQMGTSIANVIDPQTGAQSPLMGQYLYTLGLLFLLSLNGHHLLIDGVFYSYRFIPIDQVWLPFGKEEVMTYILRSINTMFMIAFQMAVPVVGSLFLVDIALGIIARTVPQMNIFVVGLPIKMIVGFIILIITMGVMMSVISGLFETMLYTMRGLMQLLGGL
ncbi:MULTISPECIES: flagellar biosynthetic protein FliR [unclassified Bacillus (in: firmicutes)]|uniref:flagellar biosynthetic protein FliR n=1 Tax=unclassified Bacillus (in: firmicutes) TaxID=185979 RepID=UPI0008E0B0E6|nr:MULTISPECIES: flagellar biosynthetic protein FliR [unclassified Bacillus (in: firmicutes)]SFA73870.1 flagellar biosynthetic protein FliR [Bacillus sp. UNCCL13]SFQ64092.1 flagellar biosynthetic protein FliR [Bacillus sp. cl95]